MAGGRPLKFATPEELQKKIDVFFEFCQEKDIIPTITGLALALETSRETLCEYQERPEFVDAIKTAKLQCEHAIENGALRNKLNATFAIFNLKNNYGWKDKTETDITSGGEKMSPVLVKFIDGSNRDTS